MSDELFNQIMGAAYDFRDAHLSGSMNLKRSAHTSLAEVVRAALAAAPSQERIDALELEVRQLTEKVAALRHALRSQQLAPSAAPAEQQMVAYLDIGAGGYIDLGSELPDETLLRLPKGRHALVIAGTFGFDGYVAAEPKPAPSAAPAEADGWCAHYLPCECAPEAREGCVSWRKRKPSPTPQADSQPAQVLWVSPEQFANLVDDDRAPSGTYLPVRKTSAGKFTMPLFAARAPADSVLEDAALLHYALADGGNQSMNWQDIYEDWSGEGHFIDALRTAYRLDAARKQGCANG